MAHVAKQEIVDKSCISFPYNLIFRAGWQMATLGNTRFRNGVMTGVSLRIIRLTSTQQSPIVVYATNEEEILSFPRITQTLSIRVNLPYRPPPSPHNRVPEGE